MRRWLSEHLQRIQKKWPNTGQKAWRLLSCQNPSAEGGGAGDEGRCIHLGRGHRGEVVSVTHGAASRFVHRLWVDH